MKRRRILVILGVVVAISAAALLQAHRSTQSQSASWGRGLLFSSVDHRFVESHTEFACNLLKELIRETPGKNVIISPLSVNMGLALVYNGAAGKTKDDIARVMALNGLSLEDVNRADSALLASLEHPDPGATINVANSLWVDDSFSLRPDYIRRCQDSHRAELTVLDLQASSAPGRVNGWVARQTENRITKMIDRFDPEDVMAMIDAASLDGKWQKPFKSFGDSPMPFILPNQKEVAVPWMIASGLYKCFHNADMQAVSLPYIGGRFSMDIFVPTRLSRFNKLCQNLNAAELEQLRSKLQEWDTEVDVPRMSLKYAVDLQRPLSELGMADAFGDADFSGLSATEGRYIFISKAMHKTFLNVNEKGTQAGAATMFVMGKGASVSRIAVDRPFLFLIRDDKTGALLFMGVIVDPR